MNRPAPVFLLAPSRSCSTVSVAMLSGHPSIFGFPEMLAFVDPTVEGLIARSRSRSQLERRWGETQLSGVCRAIAEVHDGSQADDAVESAFDWLTKRSHWSGGQVFEYLLEGIAPSIGLEKSPETVGADVSFARMRAWFPDARMIHLTRHPTSSIESMYANWLRLFPQGESSLALRAALAWHGNHKRILQKLAEVPSDMWIRLRAEDLLENPRLWLGVILDWLGLEFDEGVLAQMMKPECWPFANTGPSYRLYGGDPNFLESPKLRKLPPPGPVTFEAGWRLPEWLQRQVSELAGQLEY
jgi:hypothetical protein